MTALRTFQGRVGKHAAIYSLSPLIGFLTSIVNLVILTRLLSPTEYGLLAVLLVFSSLLTVAYNLGSIQGTSRVGFGSSDTDSDELESTGIVGGDRRRVAVGTGMVFTAVVALTGTTVVWLLSSTLD